MSVRSHTKGQDWGQSQTAVLGFTSELGNNARVKPESSIAAGWELTQLLRQLLVLPSALNIASGPIGGAGHLLQSGASWAESLMG